MSNSKDLDNVSPSGSPIFRHGPSNDWQAAKGEDCIEEISNHIEKHLGEIKTVFHEIVSDTVHIDVHYVLPNENCPYIRLVTSGMSDLPMTLPEGAEAPRYTELMITIPPEWKLDQESFKDNAWYWPVWLIKSLARFPHKYNTWLGWGHTMPNGNPPEPYATNTAFNGAILLPSITVPDEFHTLQINEDKNIHFYSIIPLYGEEMDFKLSSGTNALLDKFSKFNITDVIELKRRNVIKKRYGIF
jgi:hypothetical protein